LFIFSFLILIVRILALAIFQKIIVTIIASLARDFNI